MDALRPRLFDSWSPYHLPALPFLQDISTACAAAMAHRSFDPAPHKLIPFDPVPFFLAIKSLRLDLAGSVKKLIWSEEKERGEGLCCPTQRNADGDYEMYVGLGSSRATARRPKRTALV